MNCDWREGVREEEEGGHEAKEPRTGGRGAARENPLKDYYTELGLAVVVVLHSGNSLVVVPSALEWNVVVVGWRHPPVHLCVLYYRGLTHCLRGKSRYDYSCARALRERERNGIAHLDEKGSVKTRESRG